MGLFGLGGVSGLGSSSDAQGGQVLEAHWGLKGQSVPIGGQVGQHGQLVGYTKMVGRMGLKNLWAGASVGGLGDAHGPHLDLWRLNSVNRCALISARCPASF